MRWAGTWLQRVPTTPAITALTESPASGDLNAGKTVTLTLKLSEAVTVAGGTPTLTLNDGATATYVGGSGSNALTFSYTVAAGQNTAALTATAVNLNGATVRDGAGNAASLSLTGLTQSGPQIDTLPPAPPVITAEQKHYLNKTITLTGTAEAGSTVTVYDNQNATGTTTANSSGAWSYTTRRLAHVSLTFAATATDAAGNVSGTSAIVSGFYAPKTLGYSAFSAATGAPPLLSNYIASSFAATSVGSGVNVANEAGVVPQLQLASPHHA